MCHVVCVVTFLPVGLCRMLLCRISAVLAYYMSDFMFVAFALGLHL